MAVPNLDITVEPSNGSKAEYLPLAAMTAGGKTGVKVVLRLRLENKNKKKGDFIKVKAIRFSFPGSSQPAMDMQGVNMDGSLDLDAGAVAVWSNGRVDLDPDPNATNFINNSVYLTGDPPSKIKIDVTCKDFTDPKSVTLSLVEHK